jgi:WD40 repeat protein
MTPFLNVDAGAGGALRCEGTNLMSDRKKMFWKFLSAAALVFTVTALSAGAPKPEDAAPLPPGAVVRLGDSILAPIVVGTPAFSPDGKRLAAFSSRDVLYVWDVATGKPVRRFTGLKQGERLSNNITWSPDGKTLAQWSNDGVISFLDPETGKELHRLKDAESLTYSCVAFSPDSKSIVRRSDGDNFCLYDLIAKKEVRKWPSSDEYMFFAFAPDGRTLFRATYKVVMVIDLTTGKEVARFESESFAFRAMVVSPDSKTLAVGGAHGVRLYDLSQAKNAVGTDIKHPDLQIETLSFSPDGKTLTSASTYLQCVVWDLAANKVKKQFPLTAYKRTVYGACIPVFSPDGKLLAWTCHTDERIHLTDVATGVELLPTAEKPLTCVFAFTSDGKHVAAPCSDGKLRLWDATTGKVVRTFDKDPKELRGLVFSADGKTVVGVGDIVTAWDVETGKVKQQIEIENERMGVDLAITGDGKNLAISVSTCMFFPDALCRFRWVNLETGKVIGRADYNGQNVCSIAFAPDGKTMASMSDGFDIAIWEVPTGKRLAEAVGPPNAGLLFGSHWTPLTYSADGKELLGGLESKITARDPQSAKEIHSYAMPDDLDFRAFSADGRFIAWTGKLSSARANTVVITEFRTAKTIAELKGQEGIVERVSFSADGKRVATGSTDGTILVWDLARVVKP